MKINNIYMEKGAGCTLPFMVMNPMQYVKLMKQNNSKLPKELYPKIYFTIEIN